MKNAQETIKISREAKWAVLGRAIADCGRMGENPAALIREAATLWRGRWAMQPATAQRQRRCCCCCAICGGLRLAELG